MALRRSVPLAVVVAVGFWSDGCRSDPHSTLATGGASGSGGTIPGLDTDLNYLFTIDAVNDSGVTRGTQVKSVQ